MEKWELASVVCKNLVAHSRIAAGHIWKIKEIKTGKTEWEMVQEKAAQGWDLVSVCPITSSGNTIELLFVFKRLITTTS